MNQNHNFYLSLARILDYVSTSEDEQNQVQANLKFIRDELLQLSAPRELTADMESELEQVLKMERKVKDMYRCLSNKKAATYIKNLIPDANANKSIKTKLNDVAKELAAMSKIEFDERKCRSFKSISKWFDDNWDTIEPFANELVIIDCSKKVCEEE